ncbi:MAG TPA: hypothetical protein VK574_20530 [Terracidiphilus sp.]|jgi:hypothetical protein|nr:hypothetical protein [Terracidiphilus sp.]
MRKIAVTALLLVLCAAPAFAIWPFHKKPPKDPRVMEHPKAYHPQNENLKHLPKHKVQKHPTPAK